MAGAISKRRSSPDACTRPWSGSWQPLAWLHSPGVDDVAWGSLSSSSSTCPRQLAVAQSSLQSLRQPVPLPGDPTESPTQTSLSSKGPSSGASSSPAAHDHTMPGAFLGMWKPRGGIPPKWA